MFGISERGGGKMKKMFLVVSSLIVGMVLVSGQIVLAGDILIPNGGFELADESGQPVDWHVNLVDPEENQTQVDTTVYHSGKSSLYFKKGRSPKDYEGTATPWKGGWMHIQGPEITLPKPGKYVVSGWVRQSDGPGNLWFLPYRMVKGQTNPWESLGDKAIIACTDKSGEWRFYEKVIDIPEGWTILFIMIQMLEANKAWIDDITIDPLEEEEY